MNVDSTQNTFEVFCANCVFLDIDTGACRKIHDNVRDYPAKFSSKCKGEYYEIDKARVAAKLEETDAVTEENSRITDETIAEPTPVLHLETGGTIEKQNVTEQDIEATFANESQYGRFIVLRGEDGSFLKAVKMDDGLFQMKYQDPAEELPYVSTRKVHTDQVKGLLLSYFRGEEAWKTCFDEVEPKVRRKQKIFWGERIIAVIQILGGITGAAMTALALPVLLAQTDINISGSIAFVIIYFLVLAAYIAISVAGVYLWKHHTMGIYLSLPLQILQIPQFAIGSARYLFIVGMHVSLLVDAGEEITFSFFWDVGSKWEMWFSGMNGHNMFGLNILAGFISLYFLSKWIDLKRPLIDTVEEIPKPDEPATDEPSETAEKE